ncbi:NADP-dependent malic enzyme [Candidatus Saccharibacteria bacterium]|nr:NADP-dependent malic enzyme [Candidatus Saccharibacteria bacterium]
MDIYELAMQLHKEHKGKIGISLRDTPSSREKLSAYYSPGVGGVATYTAEHPDEMRDYTWTNNLVAVISDGSSVLGLGDIGPYGAMPVMEGKSMLFKHFADINAVPIVLNVHEPEEIISTIKAIAPSFGGINLEDISAPKCFGIEERLKTELNIPVMHDDQHGTAIVTLAGLINSVKVTGKNLDESRIVIVGAGAAGTAIIKLLNLYTKAELIAVDSKGIISKNRTDLNSEKHALLIFTNPGSIDGSLEHALMGADIFIGVSRAGLLTPETVKSMADKAVIFAMANPEPEILPDVAKQAGAAIVATGRSDYPNQVNNALAFPGIFRGALDNKVTRITDEHKLAAANAIASLVPNPTAEEIIPSILHPNLVKTVAAVIVPPVSLENQF